MNVIRLCVWLVLLSLLLIPLERWLAVRATPMPRRQVAIDVALYFINSILPATILSALFSVIVVAANAMLPSALYAATAALPLALKLVLAFVIAEIGFYWGHRLSHRIAWLWRFHRVHHAPEHLYFLINTHAHPVDMIVTRLFGMTPLYVLGLAGANASGSGVPAAVIIVGTVWGFFIHSNLRIRLGWMEWLIATPAFHHWHHTSLAPLDRNFSAMLPGLDYLFGTLHLPSHFPHAYGLADEPVADAVNNSAQPALERNLG